MLLLLPLIDLLGLILLDTRLAPLRGGGLREPEDDDLPRLGTGGRPPLLGDIDLERERAGLRIGERLRLRIGDLLGGLRGRLGGERRLRGGERRRIGLPRILLGEPLAGDLSRLGAGGEGDRPLGDAGRRLGGVPPRRRTGDRRGGEPSGRLGDPPLRPIGDLLRGDGWSFRGGEDSLCRFGPSLSISAPALSALTVSLLGAEETGFGGGDRGKVNLACTTLPSIWAPSMNNKALSASALSLNVTYPYPLGRFKARSIASSTFTTSP